MDVEANEWYLDTRRWVGGWAVRARRWAGASAAQHVCAAYVLGVIVSTNEWVGGWVSVLCVYVYVCMCTSTVTLPSFITTPHRYIL